MIHPEKPTCRWGIISTGHIANWFVADLLHPRPSAPAHHIIQAIGSRSLDSASAFANKHGLLDSFSSSSLPPSSQRHHTDQTTTTTTTATRNASSDTTTTSPAPALYGTYEALYADPSVDAVYIGTPHSRHRDDCLAAIAAGKNVLCEKPMALNAREARDIFDAARARGVYVAEAMWLRHRPLVRELRGLLYPDYPEDGDDDDDDDDDGGQRRAREDDGGGGGGGGGGVIGDVFRAQCDFSFGVDVASLPASSRLRDVALGAGTFVDMGLYSLTWVLLALEDPREDRCRRRLRGSRRPSADDDDREGQEDEGEEKAEAERDEPIIRALQSFDPVTGVENHTTALLHYPSTRRHGVVSSTYRASSRANPHVFATIEGTGGVIEVEGWVPSHPTAFTVYPSDTLRLRGSRSRGMEGMKGVDAGAGVTRYEYEAFPQGFVHEADRTAMDIAEGRRESGVVPWGETVRVMGMLDEVRRQGGTVYEADLV